MANRTALLRELRPQGKLLPGCNTAGCPLFGRCGGMELESNLFTKTCFDRHCCEDSQACQRVCMKNPRWPQDLREHGNFVWDRLPDLKQASVELPLYVPVIDHKNGRSGTLHHPVVALKTSAVFKLRAGRYVAVAQDAAGLRDYFRLERDTRVVLRGTDTDEKIELYWEHREAAPEQMARLGVDLVIGPNFSHPLNVVRTETLANRWRQLECLERMHAAGLSPVPHLSAVQPADWAFWSDYLHARPGLRFVAVEFQTGNRDRRQGRQVIDRVAGIQERAGRPLHLIAVGGGQYTPDLAARFAGFTVLDSLPFMKALKRQAFAVREGRAVWPPHHTDGLRPIDELLDANLDGYEEWLQRRAGACRPRRIPLN